jgi:tetrathionate reductase subunit B
MDRRDFLKTGGALTAGTACAYGLPWLPMIASSTGDDEPSSDGLKYGMVIDLTKCQADCTKCMDACRQENNVAHHGDKKWDVHLIRKVTIEREYPIRGGNESAKAVPLLCNHCDDPPCAQACPVKATWKRPDGIVVVDQHRCIGCRYCMIACPYNARFFNYKEAEEWPNPVQPRSTHGVPQSCTLCAHRLDRGETPACVEACEYGAIVVGNLNDPDSEIVRLIAENSVRSIREDFGTKPKVFYIGL